MPTLSYSTPWGRGGLRVMNCDCSVGVAAFAVALAFASSSLNARSTLEYRTRSVSMGGMLATGVGHSIADGSVAGYINQQDRPAERLLDLRRSAAPWNLGDGNVACGC